MILRRKNKPFDFQPDFFKCFARGIDAFAIELETKKSTSIKYRYIFEILDSSGIQICHQKIHIPVLPF